jgi:hypothetical protein
LSAFADPPKEIVARGAKLYEAVLAGGVGEEGCAGKKKIEAAE